MKYEWMNGWEHAEEQPSSGTLIMSHINIIMELFAFGDDELAGNDDIIDDFAAVSDV